MKRNGRAAVEIKKSRSTKTSDTKNQRKDFSHQEVLDGKLLSRVKLCTLIFKLLINLISEIKIYFQNDATLAQTFDIIDNNQALLRRVKRQFNMSEIVSIVSNDENESVDISSSSLCTSGLDCLGTIYNQQ